MAIEGIKYYQMGLFGDPFDLSSITCFELPRWEPKGSEHNLGMWQNQFYECWF